MADSGTTSPPDTRVVSMLEDPLVYRLGSLLTVRMVCAACTLIVIAGFIFGGFFVAPALLGLGLVGVVILLLTARFAEAALLAFILFRPFSRLIPDFDIAGQAIGLDGMINLALVAAFLIVLPFRRPLPMLKSYSLFFIMFLLIGLVTLPQSTDLVYGARQLFRFMSYLLLFWIAYTARSERFASQFMNCFLAVAIVLCVMGLVDLSRAILAQSWAGYLMGISGAGALEGRITGFQTFPFTFANQLLLVMPVVYWKAHKAQTIGTKTALYGLLLLCMMLMLATGARSAYVAFCVEVLILFVALRKLRLLAVCGLIFLAIGFGSGLFQARAARFLAPQAKVDWNSLDERREVWEFIDVAIWRQPIRGYGLGTVDAYIGNSPFKNNARVVGPHCDYRKFAFEMGIPGGLVFTAMFFSVILSAWRRRSPKTQEGFLAAATAATGAAWMTIALIDEIMQSFLVMSMWWSFAGMALGYAEFKRRSGEDDKPEAEQVEASPSSLGSG